MLFSYTGRRQQNFLLGKYSIHFFKLIVLSVSLLERHGKKKGALLSKVPKCFVEGKVGSHVSKYSFLREKDHAIKGV